MKYPSILLLTLAAGCSSIDVRDPAAIERAHQQAIGERNEAIELHIADLPEWVMTPPMPDKTGMYAVGMGDSDNIQLALKKARLEAEFGLAKLYSQELSGSERLYSTDDNGASNLYVGLIDKLVRRVPVVGFDTVKQDIKAANGKYQAYVLLKLPYDEFNTVLKQQREKQTALDMVLAFQDLEMRLDKRRDQILAESEVENKLSDGLVE